MCAPQNIILIIIARNRNRYRIRNHRYERPPRRAGAQGRTPAPRPTPACRRDTGRARGQRTRPSSSQQPVRECGERAPDGPDTRDAPRARRHRQMEIARADRIADASRLSAPLPYALLTRRQRPSTHDTLFHPPVSGVCGSLVSRRRAHKPPSRTAATPLTSHVHARHHAHTAHVHTRDVHQRPDAPITLQPENRHAHVPTYPSLECMPYARKLGSK